MTVEPAIFTCSICGEPSTGICAYCTKDACENHRCTRCKRCSDCCECEVPLSEEAVSEPASELKAIPAVSTSDPVPPTPISDLQADRPETPAADPLTVDPSP